jgi:hypothetical protein
MRTLDADAGKSRCDHLHEPLPPNVDKITFTDVRPAGTWLPASRP